MSEFLGRLDDWSLLWSESLWRASLLGGLAIAAAWAIARWCCFLSARVRCWVWRLACLKLLVAFVWSQPFELAVLPAGPARPAVIGARAPVPPAESALRGRPSLQAAAAVPSVVRQAHDDAPQFTLASTLFLLWLAGVACGIGLTAMRWRAIARLRRQTEPVTSAAWLRELCDEAERMAIRRLPRLRFSREAHQVQLVGVARPAIILPAESLESLSEEEQRLVLAHELAHLKRRDLAWNWLPAVARCLFFFHPLVWILVRGWCRAQETACDELVIQGAVARRASYGRLLLKMATRWPDERQNALVAAGISGSYRQLEHRILAMTRVKPHSTWKLAAALAAAVLIVTLGVIPWRLVAQEPARPAPRNATDTGSGAQASETVRLAPFARITLVRNDSGAIVVSSSTSSTSGSSSSGTTSGSSSTGVVLPGKLYLRTSVEIKTKNGATGKYWGIIAVDPNSGEWERLDADGFSIRVSPAGDRLAFCQFSGPPVKNTRAPTRIVVSTSRGRNLVQVAKEGILPLWSHDGKELLYSHDTWTNDDHSQHSAWLFDLADKQLKKLPIPETDEVDDWSRDGAWLVTVANRQPPFGHGYQLYVMHPDGTHERRITDGTGLNCYPRFRPGTNQVVYHHQSRDDDGSLWLVDLDGKNRKQLLACDKNGAGAPNGCCWSPDGAWLAVRRFDWLTDVPGVTDLKHTRTRVPGQSNDRLEIVAADGTSHWVLTLKDVTKIEWIDSADWQ